MTTYTTLTDAELDPNQPITSAKLKALRDNPLAILEGDSTAPKHGTGIISGYVKVDAGVLTDYQVNPSIDGIGSGATSSIIGVHFCRVDLNVDWGLTAKGDINIVASIVYTGATGINTRITNELSSSTSYFILSAQDISGSNVTSFEINFMIAYNRAGVLPVGY